MKYNELFFLVIPNIILGLCVLFSGLFDKDKKKLRINSLSLIDQLNHKSKLLNLNSGYKLAVSLIFLVLCLINRNILVSIQIILFLTFITVSVGKINLIQYLKLFLIPLSFLILSCLAISLNFGKILPNNIIYSFNFGEFHCFVTKNSLFQSITIFFRVIACISSLYFLIVNTPIDRILMVLRRLHFPNILIELMFLIYRFIFFLWEISSQMVTAAKLRFGFESYPQTIKSIGLIGSNVFIISFKKAQNFYNSMESRLYSGSFNFIFNEPKITPLEYLLFGLIFCYFCFLFYLFQ